MEGHHEARRHRQHDVDHEESDAGEGGGHRRPVQLVVWAGQERHLQRLDHGKGQEQERQEGQEEPDVSST